MAHKRFNKQDCLTYLDRNVIAQGYQPIHITMANNSEKTFHFDPMNISLPTAPYYQVADLVHTSTKGRVLGYGIASLVFWPFLIPAVVDGLGSAEANKQLDIDFANKSLSCGILYAWNFLNGLIFVPFEYAAQHFEITLVDQETNDRYTVSTDKPEINV